MNIVELVQDLPALIKGRKWLAGFILVLISPLLIAVAAFTVEWDASYSVSARTQYLEVGNIEQVQPAWAVKDVRLEGAETSSRMLSGRIKFPVGSRIILDKIGDEPAVVTVLPGETSESSSETLLVEADGSAELSRIKLPAFIELSACSEAVPKLVLPLTGMLVLGREVGDQVDLRNPILVSGTVRVLGRELLSPNRFEAGHWELDSGDRLTFEHTRSGNELGAGFLSLSCDEQIEVVYHTPARKAVVSRFGSAGYTIMPTIWSRLVSDTFFQIAFVMYSSLAPLFIMGILGVYRVRTGRHKT